jgi:hypothetical protein
VSERQGSAVADVMRDIVAEVAPEELPVADGLPRLGDVGAVRRLARRRRRREPPGLGLGEVVPGLPPAGRCGPTGRSPRDSSSSSASGRASSRWSTGTSAKTPRYWPSASSPGPSCARAAPGDRAGQGAAGEDPAALAGERSARWGTTARITLLLALFLASSAAMPELP